jgi:tetratricopeptide (TPR) repeat protein
MLAMLLGLVLTVPAQAQTPDVRALFEAGSYRQVVDAVAGLPSPDPATLYLGALSHQKLGDPESAKPWLARLASMPDADPWHLIGQSAVAIVEGRPADAMAPAKKATEAAPGLLFAHFQHGLALAGNQDYVASAAAFEQVVSADPRSAYGHYYAGLAYSRFKRVDKMAAHFEAFLKLAPNAPERAEVSSIMRTVRGR